MLNHLYFLVDLGGDSLLAYLAKYPMPDGPLGQLVTPNGVVGRCCAYGDGPGEVEGYPDAIVSASGSLIVADRYRIQEITRSGAPVRVWDSAAFSTPDGPIPFYVDGVERLWDGSVLSSWEFSPQFVGQPGTGRHLVRSDERGNMLSRQAVPFADGPMLPATGESIEVRGDTLVLGDLHLIRGGGKSAIYSLLGPSSRSSWRIEEYGEELLGGQPLRVVTQTDSSRLVLLPNEPVESAGWSSRGCRELELTDERLRFDVVGTGRVRVWVGGRLVIDDWNDVSTPRHAEADVQPGWSWIRVEAASAKPGSGVTLTWGDVNAPTATAAATATATRGSPLTPPPQETALPTNTRAPNQQIQIALPYAAR